MKIRRVKWNNHPVLGNLELDLMNAATGQPYSTLVFAGENGTGKTTILETLSTFLNRGTFEPFEFIDYLAAGTELKAVRANNSPHPNFYDYLDTHGQRTHIRTDKHNNPDVIEGTLLDIRRDGCVFSKARADYKTQGIGAVTTKKLDVEKYDIDNEDDFTSLKQLIVDIQNQVNAEYAQLNQGLGAAPQPWNQYYLTSKIYRFKSAFDNFFGRLKYDKVSDLGNEKVIEFDKAGKKIPIDRLSTGEKQIVFRGIYLLRNNSKLDGAAIMVDEPELSMHPTWQKSILKFYKQLFTTNGNQTVQLFVATHSEYVVEEALRDNSQNLVIVLAENNGVIEAKRIDAPSVLPTITSAETNYLAFDIVSNDYHIELYGWLQINRTLPRVKACDTFILNHPLYNPAIHYKPSAFGVTNYDTLCTFIRNAIDHPGPGQTFTEQELRTSIELLIQIC